jgi:3-oxoadipate enol-lactonase
VSTDTVTLNHRTQGSADASPVLLGPSLGTTLGMWDGLAATLAEDFHVIRFDTRGHGGSPVPDGPYTMSALAGDVLALADHLGLDDFSYVGLSLGGGIGQTLALECPDRVTSLVLCCTASKFGDPATWQERAARVRAEGMQWLAETTSERWFTPEVMREHPDETRRIVGMLAATDPVGYAGCCDALAAYDVTDRLGEIRTPTRVIGADQDPVTTPEVTGALAEGISGADHIVLEGAAHIASVARPDELARLVHEHLRRTAA